MDFSFFSSPLVTSIATTNSIHAEVYPALREQNTDFKKMSEYFEVYVTNGFEMCHEI